MSVSRECLEIYLIKKAFCPICKKPQTKRVFDVSNSLLTVVTNYRKLASSNDFSVCQRMIGYSLAQSALISREAISVHFRFNQCDGFILGLIDVGDSPTKERVAEIRHSIEVARQEMMKKEQGSYVWLVTGLSASERRIINHVCTHSSVRIVHEYCQGGVGVFC